MSVNTTVDEGGHYRRKDTVFRDRVSNTPGAKFAPEKGRYHLYVSYACPWAHRVLIVRELKGLHNFIDVTVVDWLMGEKGWKFSTPEPVIGATYISELYHKAQPDYSARYSVPVLWDKKVGTIVNNESSELIRFLNTEFNDLIDDPTRKKLDLYPSRLSKEIDELNAWVYDDINNGVYKTGFATNQQVYDENVFKLFEALDRVEEIVAASPGPYIFGDQLTEADIRLYTTIVRFDVVYCQHFKCNIAMIRTGYPALHKWVRNLYWNHPAFKDTTVFDEIKFHYTKSHPKINPYGITPAGPIPNIEPID